MTTIKKKIRKSNKKRILSNQKGMALITTLIFIFILVSFVVALLTMTSNDSKLSTLQRESTRAFYLADAGIEETFWKLNTPVEDGGEGMDWPPITDYPDPGTDTEYYQVTIEDIATDKIRITSTGVVVGDKYSSGKRKIEVTAEIDYVTEAMYQYAILADKIILFQGTPGPDITGDVHSNDDILVSGLFGDNYEGNATSSGDTNDLDDTTDGSKTGIKPVTIHGVDYGELMARAIADETATGIIHYHTSGITLGNGDSWGTVDNPITGIHFVEGNLEGKNGSEIHVENGAIIVTGNVDIKEGALLNIFNDNGYLNPDDPITALALIAQGNIKIYSKSSVLKGIVQSILPDGTSEGFIELKNGCEVTGSVIADTVYVRNKSKISYDGSMDQFTAQGDAFYKKTSWREVY